MRNVHRIRAVKSVGASGKGGSVPKPVVTQGVPKAVQKRLHRAQALRRLGALQVSPSAGRTPFPVLALFN
jgi:hypothetical protein